MSCFARLIACIHRLLCHSIVMWHSRDIQSFISCSSSNDKWLLSNKCIIAWLVLFLCYHARIMRPQVVWILSWWRDVCAMRHAPMPVAYCRTQDSQMLTSVKVLDSCLFVPISLPRSLTPSTKHHASPSPHRWPVPTRSHHLQPICLHAGQLPFNGWCRRCVNIL